MSPATPDNKEKIRLAVAAGNDDAYNVSCVTEIAQTECTRLLNLLCKEGTGVIRTRRGHYSWCASVPKPKVEKPTSWLGVVFNWVRT